MSPNCILPTIDSPVVEFQSIMAKRNLNFITGNKNKLAEVSAILQDVVDLRSQSVDLVEIQGTIEEISKDKCRRAAEAVCLITQRASFETGSFVFVFLFVFLNKLIKIVLSLLKLMYCLEDTRSRPSRRYMPLLQRPQRATWTIHVRRIFLEFPLNTLPFLVCK